MQVLLCLIEGRGSTVSRDTLILRVWGEAGATDDLVSRAVSELRRAFGDDPRRPRVIETIRKRGYRLLMPAIPLAGPAERIDSDSGAARFRWRQRAGGKVMGTVLALAVVGTMIRGLSGHPGQQQGLFAHPLSSLPGPELQPRFSPDGQMIAFAYRAPDSPWRSVAIVPADGSGGARNWARIEADVFSPAWSPDGQQLAAIATDPAGCALITGRLTTRNVRTIGPCPAADARFAVWLNRDTLVVNGRATRSAVFRLYAVSVVDGGARPLTTPPPRSIGDEAPLPMPDGRAIAFIRRRTEGVSEVLVLDRASGAVRPLTTDAHTVYGVAWDPAAGGLMIASNRAGRVGLWRVPLRAGTPNWVMGTEGPAWDLAIAPDGRRLVFERRSLVADIWRYPLGRSRSRQPVRIVGSTAWDAKPRVDPSGRRLLFESNRSGTYELWATTAAGDRASRLTRLGSPYDGSGAWSHDGRRVAFNARTGGNGDIWLLDTASGQTRRLTGPAGDDAVPSWSQDDQWIYFASDRSGRWEIWKMPADSGKAIEVTRTGGYRALEVAPDHVLYFTRPDTSGIWRLVPGRERPELVVPDLSPGDFDNWALRGRELVYLSRAAKARKATLRRYTLPQGPVVSWTTVDSVPREPGGIDVTPDGAWVYVTRITRNESDLLVVDDPSRSAHPAGSS